MRRIGEKATREELVQLLRECVEKMEEETQNREGDDIFDFGCGNCIAGVPMPHSWGCLLKDALYQEAK